MHSFQITLSKIEEKGTQKCGCGQVVRHQLPKLMLFVINWTNIINPLDISPFLLLGQRTEDGRPMFKTGGLCDGERGRSFEGFINDWGIL